MSTLTCVWPKVKVTVLPDVSYYPAALTGPLRSLDSFPSLTFQNYEGRSQAKKKKLSATHFQDSPRHGSAWSKKKNSPK